MTNLRALIVEDSEDDYTLLVRELQRGGYGVTALRVDSPEAFRAALGQGSWDIIFADYTMPRFNALSALEITKEAAQDLPFIIVSGTIGEDVAVAAMKAGAQDYFMKGNLARFIPAVERELREAGIRQEQRRAEEAQRRLSTILDATTDFVGIADPQGHGLYLNLAGRQLFGIDPAEDITRFPLAESFPERFRPLIFEEAIPAAIRDNIWRGEAALLDCDGREIPVSQVIIAHKAPDGTLEFLSTIARDISNLKQSEEALLKANLQLQDSLEELLQMQGQLIQQERLQALRQLSGSIIHDMSNLLTSITGFADLLLSRSEFLSDPNRVRHNLEMISRAGRDAADIIRGLRLFYQAPGQPENVFLLDLNQIVRDAASLTEPIWGAQAQASGNTITVETDLEELPPIEGNEVKLREMLTNLIFNAVDALSNGGTITLRTRNEGAQVALQLADTGTGMTDEVLQRCLEPFFTTRGAQGTGLGLAVVYGIITAHGGSVNVESQPGKGTIVTVHFPARAGEIRVIDRPPGIPQLNPMRILVADDDPLVLQVFQEYLKTDGHTVDLASDGSKALEKLRYSRFDLLITDLAMPEMDGISLARAAKELNPQMPVLLISGFADQLIASEGKPEAVDLILSKPVGIEQFRQSLSRVTAKLGV